MFKDRLDAAMRLVTHLSSYRGHADSVIGLSHGGVAVSAVISRELQIPQQVLVVKKIGSPGNPELAVGAVVPGGQKLDVRGKSVIITDDGAATGETMSAAAGWVKKQGAREIIIALPVAPRDVAEKLRRVADDVVVLETPLIFGAVGEFYDTFTQMTDKDVVELTGGKI